MRGWPTLELKDSDLPAHFSDGGNVGLILGTPSSDLVDIDLDAPEGLAVADCFLPQTASVFGRASKLRSHRLYYCDPPSPRKLSAPDGVCLVELRSTGQQTVVPPSTHPSGEVIAWASDGEPAVVDKSTLESSFGRVAAAALLARYWPPSGRHEARMALGGALARAGWTEEETVAFVRSIVQITQPGDHEADRKVTGDTRAAFAKLQRGEPVTGLPRLGELVGDGVARLAVKWLALGHQSATARPSLISVSISELLEREIKPREMLLAPILPEQGLAMLYAYRGIGKTFIALGIAAAVASGSRFLRWTAPRPRRVLYLDGELPAKTVQERSAMVLAGIEGDRPAPDAFRIITPDFQERPIPDLSTVEGQGLIEPHLNGIDLLVLDNLSALCRYGNENEGESWLPVQEWGLALRRRGISVLFVHHAGKNRSQRGTSRREDLLDTVVTLKHPVDYNPSEGLRCEVHFEKTRGMLGEAAKPFEVRLETGTDGRAIWTHRDLEDAKAAQAAELFAAGTSVRRVAEKLGISKSTASRLRQKWQASHEMEVSQCPTG